MVFARFFAGVVAANHFVNHHGVQSASGQIHECSYVVAKGFDFFQRFVEGFVFVHGIHGAAAVLHANHLAGKVSLVLYRRAAGNDDDLVVHHIGLGEGHVFLALFGNGHAVPQRIDAVAFEFGLFGAPVNGLEFGFDVHALGCFACHVDVVADQLTFFIAKTHGREVVVQADHQFFWQFSACCGRGRGGTRSGGCLGFGRLAAPPQHNTGSQGGKDGNQARKTWFHGEWPF